MIDDVVEGFEDSVGQPVLAYELPDILLAVEFVLAGTRSDSRRLVERSGFAVRCR
jgi:hypothetical protein